MKKQLLICMLIVCSTCLVHGQNQSGQDVGTVIETQFSENPDLPQFGTVEIYTAAEKQELNRQSEELAKSRESAETEKDIDQKKSVGPDNASSFEQLKLKRKQCGIPVHSIVESRKQKDDEKE